MIKSLQDDWNRVPWDREGIVVSVDTETSGLFPDEGARVSVVSMAWESGGGGVAFPFDQGMLPDKPHIPSQTTIDEMLEEGDVNLGEEEWNRLMKWLERQWILTHNAKFDLILLGVGTRVWGGGVDLTERVFWDSMLAQRILDPLKSAGLKETAVRLWGGGERAERDAVDDYLKSRKWSSGKMDLVPWSIIGPYATKDAELTLKLWEHQRERLAGKDAEFLEACEHEMKLMRVLTKMEGRGVGFDVERCKKNAELLKKEVATVKKSLPFEATPAGAKEYYFGKGAKSLGLIPETRTPVKGDPVLNIEALRRLSEDGQPWAKDLAYLRNCESALSKWYDNWPVLCGADGRLRTCYNQANVVSGRLSVSRVQLQALPHEYRLPQGVEPVKSMIVPKEGYVLWEADVSQAEVRVVTAISGCKAMRKIIEGGGDIHGETAKLLFGIDESDPNWKQTRLLSKRTLFSELYGAGADKIREVIYAETGRMLSKGEMENILQAFHSKFPELRQLARDAENRVKSRGYLKLINGRRRYFKPEEETFKSMNAVVQGNVAVAIGMWMRGIESALPGALILQVHDSVLLELPDDEYAEEKTRQICEGGCVGMKQLFNIEFKIEYGKWGT